MLTLDPAQVAGRSFLASVAPYSGGDHLLADVPGLGKTAQAITAANSIPWIQDILVVVPAIARVNWQREWARWSPGREVTVVYKLADCPARPRGVLIVSANALSIDTKHGKRLRRILNGKVWDLAIVDEAHYFKDIKSRRTRGLYGQNAAGERCVIAKAVRRWMLTGTPMPNHPGELWPMFRAIWPHLIRAGHGGPMTYEDFILTYCQVKKNEMGELVPIGVKSPAQLRALLDMVMLRRTVVDGLPPLIWQDEPFLVECGTRELARLERHPEFQDMSNVLAAIESTSQGLEGLEDDYLHMATLRRLTGRLKAKAAAEYIDYVLQHDTKAVILAVHREVIEVLEEELAHLNPAVVHGGKTNRQQVEAIDKLNNDPTCRVAIGQIETVKTAINMQAATEVIFVEQQFTPSDNSQAVARAHRRGQKYPVNVSVLAIAGSFDEVIQRVLARKSKAINSVLEN
jgi:SNF2 family DNA or RNA helicase